MSTSMVRTGSAVREMPGRVVAAARPAARAGRRLALERLEDRWAPATVTSLAAEGPGTLSRAVGDFNSSRGTGPWVIDFAPGLTGTIHLEEPLYIRRGGLTIVGPGASQLTISGRSIKRVLVVGDSGSRYDRPELGDPNPTTISGLTFAEGRDNGPSLWGSGTRGDRGRGGAILNYDTLTLTNCVVRDSVAQASGGGIFNQGILKLTNCTIMNNQAGGTEFGSENVQLAGRREGGGGICNNWVGGRWINCTLINCTLTGNRSMDDQGGALTTHSGVALVNCTVTRNIAPGYTQNAILGFNSQLWLTNNIITGLGLHFHGGHVRDVFGTNNIIPDFDFRNGRLRAMVGLQNTFAEDPRLGTLGTYGGQTPIFPLLEGSPAIDAGAALPPLHQRSSDQRGLPFRRHYGPGLDIGAYEAQSIDLRVSADDDEQDALYRVTDLSLREAVALANANPGRDTIRFSLALAPTIDLTLGELALTDAVTIAGPGASALTVNAGGASRIFRIDDGVANRSVAVMIRGLTLAGGRADRGGAVLNLESLTVLGCALTGNTADVEGGAVANDGTLRLRTSTLTGNSARQAGSGLSNRGTADLARSTLADNAAHAGGGVANFRTATLTNCTLAANTAGFGGGVYNLATARLSNCTLGGNTAGSGGVYNFGTATLDNTIVAGSGSGDLVNFGTARGRKNLVADGTGGGLLDTLAGDPLLGALGYYGGPTPTLPLLPGSPAIDAGGNALVPARTPNDQRGYARVSGGRVDIGAFENRGFTLTVAGGDNQQAAAGAVFAGPLMVLVTSLDPVEGGVVTFLAPAAGASTTRGLYTDRVGGNDRARAFVRANGTAGIYLVVAVAGGADPVSFTLTNT